MIDSVQLTAIAAGHPTLILELLSDFLAESQNTLEDLATALSSQDLDLSADILHKISGSSGSLGLSDLHKKVKQHEIQCRASHHPGHITDDLLHLLSQSVEQARLFLL